MALAAQGQLKVGGRNFFMIFEVIGQLAVASRAGDGGVSASCSEGLDHFMTLIARGFFFWNGFFLGIGIGEEEEKG
jgi:hypothetical protein